MPFVTITKPKTGQKKLTLQTCFHYQFEYPDITDAIKKAGYKRIPLLYAQKYTEIAEDVYLDSGSRKDYNGTATMYKNIAVPDVLCNKTSDDEIEMGFWENIVSLTVDYGAAVDDTIFKQTATHIWNTNHIISSLCHLRTFYAKKKGELFDFPGITTPFLYYGNAGTTFALHIEDMALWSCNFNRGPGNKLWYVVPPSSYQALKDGVEASLKNKKCAHPIQHKNVLVNPKFFQKRGIPYTRVSRL